jgi:hypothetical protein
MQTRKTLVAGTLAAFLALAGVACEAEDFEGDPLEDDAPADNGDDGDGGY